MIAPMNTDWMMLLLYMVMALGVSFLCSVAEAVLLSITPSYIEHLKVKNPRHAALLKQLKQDKLDRSLAAILTLNTIAHTVGAIGAGAKATVIFGNTWFGVFSAVMTLMILFLSEIIPKTLGAVYWTGLSGLATIYIKTIIVILYPIVWVSEKMTTMISHGQQLHVFSREEFIAMARMGERTGQIPGKESRIIRNIFKFESLRATDIMTPRTVIAALPEDMKIAEALQFATRTPFSRLPVYRKNIDQITGFVFKDDILIHSAQKRGDETLTALKRDILVVPDTVSLPVLLERILENRQHIVVVINEYGGTEGLVTLEDLVETLMGMEIMDERDNVEDMRALARKQWEERITALGLNVDAPKTDPASPEK